MKNAVLFRVLPCLVLLMLGTTAFAQSNTGRLVGTVLGPDGGAISGAAIVITDNQTKKERSLTSSAEGLSLSQRWRSGLITCGSRRKALRLTRRLT